MRRITLILVVALSIATIASAQAENGPPGRSPENPITVPGPPLYPPTSVDIWWPDGSSERVFKNEPPSQALNTATIAERAQARAERGGGSGKPNARRPLTIQAGITACSFTLSFPYKVSSTTAGASASVACTPDVFYIGGSLYLFRSANLTLIGHQTKAGGTLSLPRSSMVWATNGGCLSSTWQYHAQLTYNVISGVNGARVAPAGWAGPSWITC